MRGVIGFRFLVSLFTALALLGTIAVAGNYRSKKDIVDTAVASGDFETLVAAVQAAGLVETLKGDGPFTLFAPTDEAFAKLPEGTLEALLQDTDKLTAILTYHVVAGSIMAADVVLLESAETVNCSAGSCERCVDGSNWRMDSIRSKSSSTR